MLARRLARCVTSCRTHSKWIKASRRTVGTREAVAPSFSVCVMALKREGAEGAKGGDTKKKQKKASAPAKDEKSKFVQPDAAPRQILPEGERGFNVAFWNVGSLRATLDKRSELLEKLVESTSRPEVIFLAEHKLQPGDALQTAEKDLFKLLPGYRAIWNCAEKKGYSGVVALLKEEVLGAMRPSSMKNKSVEVSTPEESLDRFEIKSCHRGLGIPPLAEEYNREGRVITLNFEKPNLYVVVAYVPNSGAGLKRIDYRLDTWERDMRAYIAKLEEEKPVAYLGDMNVAHLDEDIWNPDAKHLEKNAGTTTRERNAFSAMLDGGLVDGFRYFHPSVKGNYTFWSIRARNRPHNRGLRLDYTLVSESMVNGASPVQLADAYIVGDVCADFGDHCPVAMTVKY